MSRTKHDKAAAAELHDDALDQAAGGVLASATIGRGLLGDADGNGQVDGKDLVIAKPRP